MGCGASSDYGMEPMEPKIMATKFEWRNRPDKVDQNYEFLETLGRGSHAKVKLGKERKSGELVAIKVMDRKSPKFEYDTLCREIKVMKAVDHPGCIKLYDVFEDRDKCYLVQELASGGELFDRVIANGAFSEKDAASLVKQLFEAVGYLHSCGICHRDLKPENLLMKSADQTSHYYNVLKLADFGLSTFQAGMSQNVMLTACGTPEYIAPEVIAALEDTDDERIPYSAKVDIWAVGVICYVLLCGYQPFQLENQKAMYSAIRKGKYGFPSPEWDHVSDEAKAFIRFVLKLDPASRPPAAECLRQPWVASIELRRTQSLSGASLRLQENLARYTEQRKKNRLQQVMTAAQRGLRRLSIRSMESMTALIDPIRRGSKATQTSQISLPPSSASANDSLEASRHLSSAGPPGGHVDQSPTDGAIERSTSAGSETPWVDGELDAPEAPTV